MTLPNSPEAEDGLLGSMAVDNRVLASCVQMGILPNYFFNPANTVIMETLMEMDLDAVAVDFITLGQRIRDKGQYEAIGGHEKISKTIGFPTAAKWRDYAAIVVEKFRRRKVISDARTLADLAQNEAIEMPEIEGVAQNLGLESSKAMVANEEVRHIKHGVMEFIEHLERASSGKDDRVLLDVGLPNLERLTGGMPPGNFITVGAQTSVGKTAFALQCAWSVAYKQQKPVLFVSLEMTQQKLAGRILAATSGVPMTKLYARRPELSEYDHAGIHSGILKVGATNLLLWTPGQTPTAEQVVAMMKMQKIKHPDLALVVVDYLQLLAPGSFKDNREQQVAQMSRTLMRAAVSLNVTTIALSQLNDDNELRESRSIGHDSRIVIQLTRPKGEDKGERTLHLDKNGEGQSKISFPLHFNGQHQTFREVYED